MKLSECANPWDNINIIVDHSETIFGVSYQEAAVLLKTYDIVSSSRDTCHVDIYVTETGEEKSDTIQDLIDKLNPYVIIYLTGNYTFYGRCTSSTDDPDYQETNQKKTNWYAYDGVCLIVKFA